MSQDGGVPDLVDVQVEDPHVKVGDGMISNGETFIIGQIAVVGESPKFDVVFFDTHGKEQGRLHLVEQR